MRKILAIALVVIMALGFASVAFAEDSSTNYRNYTFRINGGGEASGFSSEVVKKYIDGNAVVRCKTLKANGSSISGYGWAELWTRVFPQKATSTDGSDNKVYSGNDRAYIPYINNLGRIDWEYKFRMRTPKDYKSSVTYTYEGTWSPDM